jgi:hypothetical protein
MIRGNPRVERSLVSYRSVYWFWVIWVETRRTFHSMLVGYAN